MKVCANQNKICVGGGRNAISKLCTINATKNVLVDGSAEPSSRGILVWRRGKWIKHRNETSSDIFKLKNMYTYEKRELAERQLSAPTATKWLVARQAMQ